MLIVGCDYHPSFQQIAWVETNSGEVGEGPLMHSTGEAERFYRKLKEQGVEVRVGIEATGHARWFERLLAELGFELWVGDAAEIKAKRVRKQKNDREDARLLRTLLIREPIPARVVAGCEQSRSAAAVVASPPAGADANASHESASGSGSERGSTAEERAMEPGGKSAARIVSTVALGNTAS